MFAPHSLSKLIRRATAAAIADGSQQPIATTCQEVHETVGDQQVTFLVRIVDNLRRKDEQRQQEGRHHKEGQPCEDGEDREQAECLKVTAAPHVPADSARNPESAVAASSAARPAAANPFLPYDRKLYVADLLDDYVCLLNKYNVVEDHLLIVTRHFEHQQSQLTLRDFTALLACMAEYPSLGFYNSGPAAGASQPHKHLQLIPLPLAPGPESWPLERLWQKTYRGAAAGGTAALPFCHRLARWRTAPLDAPAAAQQAWQQYRDMLRVMKLASNADERPRPYNLLMTAEWLLVVPRSAECWQDLSLNAMAFAGALLVRTPEQLEVVRQAGPLQLLCATTFPPCP